MRVDFDIPDTVVRFLHAVGPKGRKLLHSAAASSVCVVVRNYLVSLAARRHATATELGAKATGHIAKGARKTVFHADEHHGEVDIPIPGISRAFHDIEIRPKHAKALTIPVHPMAYGRRVLELQLLGWKTFIPKPKDGALMAGLVMGVRDGEVAPLYILKQRVRQRQDRSLLPHDSAIRSAAVKGILLELNRIRGKSSQ